MLRRLRFLFMLFVILLPMTMIEAQGAPPQINTALADLSRRIGQSVGLNNLSDWRWSQDNYPDASLGCSQPGTAYAEAVTPGYRFLMTYQGILYDYRVSADNQIVILCSQVSAEEVISATPTVIDPNAIDTSIPCPYPEPGVIYLPTRLTTNIQVRVVPGPPNNQRSDPSADGIFLGEIPGGAIVNVVAGPQCSDGLVWWQVDYDGRVGWTVEGRDGAYWLESIPGLPLAANRSPITVQNADLVGELSRTANNVIGALKASPDGITIAVLGGLGTDGVWLYNLSSLDQGPRLLRGTVQLESLNFNFDGTLLALGDVTGGLRLWDTDPRTRLLERAYFGAHQSNTSAVAFSPGGDTVASVGSIANTLLTTNRGNAILLWDIEAVAQQNVFSGHTARVNALAFNPDGTLLASASGSQTGSSTDNTVRLWDIRTGQQVAVLEGHNAPVYDVEFSPDGASIASASADGSIILWDAETRGQSRVLQSAGTAVNTIAFSPDGTLLASAGGDPNAATADFNIYVWNIQTGEVLVALSGHTGIVSSIDFTPDGSLLASVSDDRSLRFWGVKSAG